MAKEVMKRNASDNEYLHKDFHGALSAGIDYLEKHFGEKAVRDYLRDFTRAFYAPLIDDLKERGLVALKEHFKNIYRIEGAEIDMDFSENELVIKVAACPAVTHMREHGYSVARLFYETTRTVNETLCGETPFTAELLEYDEATGRGVQRFYRREK